MTTYTDAQVGKIRDALEKLVSYTLACEGLLNASPAGQLGWAKEALAELDKPVEPEAVAIVIQANEVDLEGNLTHQRDLDYYQEDIDSLPVGTQLYKGEII